MAPIAPLPALLGSINSFIELGAYPAKLNIMDGTAFGMATSTGNNIARHAGRWSLPSPGRV